LSKLVKKRKLKLRACA